jgi:hypothetical protein
MSWMQRAFAVLVFAVLLGMLLRPPRPVSWQAVPAGPPPVPRQIVTSVQAAPRVTVYQREQADGVASFGDRHHGGQVRVVDHGQGNTFSGSTFSGRLPQTASATYDAPGAVAAPPVSPVADPIGALRQANLKKQQELVDLRDRQMQRQIGE